MEHHSDMLDRAAELTRLEVEHALQNRTIEPKLIANGACHYCLEPLVDATFCDADCRDDYQNEVDAKKRNGR